MIYNYINRILFFAFFVTIVSCDDTTKTQTAEEELVNLSELLKNKFDSTEELIYETDTLLASEEVLNYYSENQYIPIWTTRTDLNEAGNEFLSMIENAYDYGFLPEMFHSTLIHGLKDSSIMDAEMVLSNAFYLYATHISVGCVDTVNLNYVWRKDSLPFSLDEELLRVQNGENVHDIITEHQPQFWDYLQLQKGLENFLDSFDLDTNHYIIPGIKEDSLICYNASNKALMGHYFLDSTNFEDDSIFIEKLKDFQLVNGLKDDAIVGKWTGRALAKSNLDRFYQAALSLEKWRWKTQYPNRYIRVNIPEFTLYFVDNDSVKRKHRVVVGAYKTQTPEFHATMQRMITNPFWHVPYSISSTEILYNARKDSNYFDRRGYKIFKSGEQVDPAGVNWSAIGENNFPYRIRQNGGGGNSLGRIKFLFPNVHSVFIHDTPSKSLFKNDVRAYSHGCVRLHEPYELAKAMLISDKHKVPADSLETIIRKGQQKVLELTESFEVYLEYFTATGDSAGHILFHPDIYDRDQKYLNNSFKLFTP